MSDVKARVARGAAWLDEKYPDWFKVIDLAILDVASCRNCVLGQVYTGIIPAEERGQLVAQVVTGIADSCSGGYDYWKERVLTTWHGYDILSEFHALPGKGRPYGFLAQRDVYDSLDEVEEDYRVLLDEWIRVIIGRRLAVVG